MSSSSGETFVSKFSPEYLLLLSTNTFYQCCRHTPVLFHPNLNYTKHPCWSHRDTRRCIFILPLVPLPPEYLTRFHTFMSSTKSNRNTIPVFTTDLPKYHSLRAFTVTHVHLIYDLFTVSQAVESFLLLEMFEKHWQSKRHAEPIRWTETDIHLKHISQVADIFWCVFYFMNIIKNDNTGQRHFSNSCVHLVKKVCNSSTKYLFQLN